jgi:predicted HAD superfamily Cof-like phosphohydrolase
MDPVFREVHRSNLSKVGGYKREDGKWVKPPTYSPADVTSLLASQLSQRVAPVSQVETGVQESEV